MDLIVTSPPYFDLERYGETGAESEGQIWTTVDSAEAYVAKFLRPVLLQCVRLLARGGLLALNVDDNVGMGVILCQPVLDILKGRLRLVGTAGLRKGKGYENMHGASQARAEPIYLFVRQ